MEVHVYGIKYTSTGDRLRGYAMVSIAAWNIIIGSQHIRNINTITESRLEFLLLQSTSLCTLCGLLVSRHERTNDMANIPIKFPVYMIRNWFQLNIQICNNCWLGSIQTHHQPLQRQRHSLHLFNQFVAGEVRRRGPISNNTHWLL